jgi:diaminopimelate decarboxylase
LHYALKANTNATLVKVLHAAGAGVDVVSLGELEHALHLGFAPEKIVFSGVGKSAQELHRAVEVDIAQINIESLPELLRLLRICQAEHKTARVAVRLNPDVEAKTHPYIQTGFRDNKFGVDEATLPELLDVIANHPAHLSLQGLTLHIGSQIRDLQAFREAFKKTKFLWLALKKRFANLCTLDIGGGLGIDYTAAASDADARALKAYLQLVGEELGDLPEDVRLLAEPGRILVARCGLLICQVEYIKQTAFKNFAIVNTGMHHLLRPALYQAHHRIERVSGGAGAPVVYDVVGPICESSDTLGRARPLARLAEGDKLAVFDAGAYGAVMACQYNLHDKPREYVIVAANGGKILPA